MTASKVDCYSYAMVLWVLMAWQLPYRKLSVMQVGERIAEQLM